MCFDIQNLLQECGGGKREFQKIVQVEGVAGFLDFLWFFFFLEGPEMRASSRSCSCKRPPGVFGAHSTYANAPIC